MPGIAGDPFGGRTWGVEWSPDSREILFVVAQGEGATASSSLRVVFADGSAADRAIADGVGNEYGPSWSPTGDRIAFLRRDASGTRTAVVADIDGSGEQVIASGVAGFTPQWSPDGRSVAYVEAFTAAGGSIRIVRLDGSAPDVVVSTTIIATAWDTTPGVDAIGWQRIAR